MCSVVACRNQLFFLYWPFFELLSFLLLYFIEYLILLDICFAPENVAALVTRYLFVNFVLLAAFHARLAVHLVVIKSFYCAVCVHDALLGQQLLL